MGGAAGMGGVADAEEDLLVLGDALVVEDVEQT